MNKSILLRGGAFSLFSFFSQGVNFLLLLLLANYIAPDDYGSLSLFTTITTFFGYFIALSCQGYVSISFFKENQQGFKEDLTSIFFISLVVFSFFAILLLLFPENLSRILQIKPLYLWIALVISISSLTYSIVLDLNRVKEKITIYGLLSCTFALINFLLTIFFVINRHYNWQGRVYAQLVTYSSFAIIGIVFLIKAKLLIRKINIIRIKTILMWGIPLIPHSISTWIKQGCDRYIINDAFTLSDVGLFSFSLNLINIIIMIGVAFNATNSVEIFKTLSSNEKNKLSNLKNNTRLLFFIYLAVTLGVLILGVFLIPCLFPEYTDAVPFFAILCPYGLLHCLYFLFTNYLFYYKANKHLMYVTFGTACFHLILSFIMSRYSMYYTCIIYIVSQLLTVYLVKELAYRLLKKNLDVSSVNLLARD